jgi:putative tryptophan/tyrosine transport system substrate-binding protein
VIGFLSSQSPEAVGHLVEAFRLGLKEAGFVEGQTVAIEYGWANGQYDRLPELAADLVSRKVAVIAAVAGSALAAKSITRTIPIVFDANDDPVKMGLVAAFNQPGGNATGVSFFTSSLDAKRMELLRDLLGSKAAAIGVLVTNRARALVEIEEAANRLGLKYDLQEANSAPDLDAAFASFVHSRADAVLVGTDPFFTASRNRLVELAASNAIPAIYGRREFAAAGGLISYGENLREAYRQMGFYVAKILKGAKTTDLPVMQLTKIELVINLKTAKALGLTIPQSLLVAADEVIE